MSILMIRPIRFGYNAQTAVNNAFQEPGEDPLAVQQAAVQQFDNFVNLLRKHDIEVLVVQDSAEPHTPDSIFPNNWISFHENGTIILYPMFAKNRRLERKKSVLKTIKENFCIDEIIDYSHYEKDERFLEGTGSFILDRKEKLVYACLSPRTDEGLFLDICTRLEYTPIVFDAKDRRGTPIYHTNVMMCIADRYAVINSESIPLSDRQRVLSSLEDSGKAVVTISHEQMEHFAGNMLQVQNKEGKHFLVMSSQAYYSLTEQQIQQLTAFNPIIHSSLDVIEKNGGGSARCMMAELKLPARVIIESPLLNF